MDIQQLSLEQILEEVKREGIFWDFDYKSPPTTEYRFISTKNEPTRKYRFVFDKPTANNIMTDLINSCKSTGLKLKDAKMKFLDRESYVVFGYETNVKGDKKVAYLVNRVHGDSIPFASAYLVGHNNEEAKREIGAGTQKPKECEYILTIESLNRNGKDDQPPFLNLMRAFYSAYHRVKFKTPSEISPTRLPSQNP